MPFFKFIKEKLILLITLLLVGGAGWYGIQKQTSVNDPNILFTLEVYDTIQTNYWEKISDQDLVNLFKAASDKASNNPIPIPSLDKKGLLEMFKTVTKDMDDEKKKEFSKQTATIVLANLKPFGRSTLYTTQQEKQLQNLVQNINPEKNLYQDLGVGESASVSEVQKAYEEKKEELAKDSSEKAKEELKKAEYAKEVLATEENKKLYDQQKVEPTIFSRLIDTDILYVYFKRFSPTTFDQLKNSLTSNDIPNGPTSLILDLRGNLGGEIDAVSYYLGSFLGPNQYVYDFYQQGEYKPFRTKTDKFSGISRYKQIVILVDNNTQSSAELMVAGLKSRGFGIVVGLPTKGWGTVEKVFPIEHQIDENERLSLFLVHHITIRDDGQPIEGRGVEPHININDPDWEGQLFDYFRNSQLTAAVKQIWNTNPQ